MHTFYLPETEIDNVTEFCSGNFGGGYAVVSYFVPFNGDYVDEISVHDFDDAVLFKLKFGDKIINDPRQSS